MYRMIWWSLIDHAYESNQSEPKTDPKAHCWFALIVFSLNAKHTHTNTRTGKRYNPSDVGRRSTRAGETEHAIGPRDGLIPAAAAGCSRPPLRLQCPSHVKARDPLHGDDCRSSLGTESVTSDPQWHLWHVKLLPAADWACPSFTHGRVLKEIQGGVIPDWGPGM